MKTATASYKVPRHVLADLPHALAPDGLVRVDGLLVDVEVMARREEYRSAADLYESDIMVDQLDRIYAERDGNVWRWSEIWVRLTWQGPGTFGYISGESSSIGGCSYASGEEYVREGGWRKRQIAGGGVDRWAPFRSQLIEAITDFQVKLNEVKRAINGGGES